MITIVKIKFGSHLYGTSTPTSDLDYKSVHIPDVEEILLQRVRGSVGVRKPKVEGEKNRPSDVDNESYAFQRYLELLAEGQTVAIDMLFAPEPEVTSELWERVQEKRHLLLTKRSAAFVGYCRQQANKYGIKGSRVDASLLAKRFFEEQREKLGTIAKVSEVAPLMEPLLSNEHIRIVTKETTPGHEETYFECCNRMVGFKNTLKEAASIYDRIYQEYGDRARRAQANDGIDWKALSHAVRVGNEALELLSTAKITFPLPNAEHILRIKQGSVAYNEVAEEIEGLLQAVEEASSVSTLRESADQEFINDLVMSVYGDVVVQKFHPYRPA